MAESKSVALFLNDFLASCRVYVVTYPNSDLSAAAISELSSPRGNKWP
jgi:hypothetical protein